MTDKQLAQSAVVDHVTATLTIDGIDFPWRLNPAPTVWTDPETGLHYVSMDVVVDGPVEVREPVSPEPEGVETPHAKFVRGLVEKGLAPPKEEDAP